jgi:8-oxo-dGTP pyrophosphatase MutT (NUDIX family)
MPPTMMTQTTLQEVSAGGVVYRATDTGFLFLIGKHSGYHKWVLPKGLVETDEGYTDCAEREVFEEVGVRARVASQTPLKTVEYFYFADLDEVVNKNPHTESTARRVKTYQEEGGTGVRVHKKVHFYLMELVSDTGEHGWEMEERQWVSFEEGEKLLAFESEQAVLRAAGEILGI